MARNILILLSLFPFQLSGVFAQITFDVYSFTIPDGYKTEKVEGSMVLVAPDEKLSILLIPLQEGNDIAYLEFGKDWARYVTSSYSVLGFPNRTITAFSGGWEMTTGQAKAFNDQATFWIQLRNFTKQERKATILFFAVDDKQQETIKKFVEGLKLSDNAVNSIAVAETSVIPGDLVITDSLSSVKQAASMKYDNFRFDVPAGWLVKESPRFLEIYPSKTKEKEIFSIILLKGKTSAASLQDELASTWDEFTAMMGAQKLNQVNGGFYNSEEVARNYSGWEYISGHGSIRSNGDFFVHTYIIRVKERIERVIVLAKEVSIDAVRNNIDPTVHHYPYFLTITDFIFNMEFTNYPSVEKPVQTIKGTGVTGVWAGLGFMGGQLKTTYMIFFPNGQVYYGSRFPYYGLYELNTYADKERNQRYWGTYQFNGGSGTVTMTYGRFPVRIEGENLIASPVSEEHKFVRVPTVDNIKLHGKWMIRDQNDQPVFITFRSDGTFKDDGALRILDHSLYEYYSIADGGGSGNYEIHDHTVIFYYSDGRILKIAFPGLDMKPGDPSPENLTLSFNNDVLVRQ